MPIVVSQHSWEWSRVGGPESPKSFNEPIGAASARVSTRADQDTPGIHFQVASDHIVEKHLILEDSAPT